MKQQKNRVSILKEKKKITIPLFCPDSIYENISSRFSNVP